MIKTAPAISGERNSFVPKVGDVLVYRNNRNNKRNDLPKQDVIHTVLEEARGIMVQWLGIIPFYKLRQGLEDGSYGIKPGDEVKNS